MCLPWDSLPLTLDSKRLQVKLDSSKVVIRTSIDCCCNCQPFYSLSLSIIFQSTLALGGDFRFLGKQLFASICITLWGFSSTLLLLWLVNKITPLRMTREDELLGADYAEHNIRPRPAVRDVAAAASSSSSTAATEETSQISQRSAAARFSQSDEKTVGAFRIHFTDDTTPSSSTRANSSSPSSSGGERLRGATSSVRNNPAYQHDDEFS